MNFSEVIGQRNIIDSLINMKNNNKVLHSYIFEGPKGIGKRTIAKIFSNLLLCEVKQDNPCGKCKSCMLFSAQSHPDIKMISSDKSIGVDEIRDIVKDVSVKPYYGGKKIYIIENAEKMTTGAQNSLLKTLEEPPEYVVIILLTENSNFLLPTIISRCIIKKFMRNNKEEIEQFILSRYPEQVDKSNILISLSDGIIGNVNEILKDDDFFNLRDECINILTTILNGTQLEAFETAEFFVKYKDNIDLVLSLMLLWLRDLLILSKTGNEGVIVNLDYINKLKLFISKININKVINAINVIIDAKKAMLYNSNYNVTIEVMILKLKNYQGAFV